MRSGSEKGLYINLKKSDMSFNHMYEAKDGNEALDIIKKNQKKLILS